VLAEAADDPQVRSGLAQALVAAREVAHAVRGESTPDRVRMIARDPELRAELREALGGLRLVGDRLLALTADERRRIKRRVAVRAGTGLVVVVLATGAVVMVVRRRRVETPAPAPEWSPPGGASGEGEVGA
jgi:hypothetical protein